MKETIKEISQMILVMMLFGITVVGTLHFLNFLVRFTPSSPSVACEKEKAYYLDVAWGEDVKLSNDYQMAIEMSKGQPIYETNYCK